MKNFLKKINDGFIFVILAFLYCFIIGLANLFKRLFTVTSGKKVKSYWLQPAAKASKVADYTSPY